MRTLWYIWDIVPNADRTYQWRLKMGRSTEVRSSNSWATRVQSEPLTATGSKARGAIRVLAARPWYQGNPASPYAYPTFNY